MRCYNIELLAPKNGLSIHEIWVRIIHGYRLFSRMDRPFLGCVLCTGAHYTRKITVFEYYSNRHIKSGWLMCVSGLIECPECCIPVDSSLN